MSSPTNQKLAIIYGLITVLLWSTVATACKITLRYIHPPELVFYATATSCLVLFSILFYQKKFTHLLKMKRADWLLACKLGIINPFLYYLILFASYDLLPAQQAQPINYTWAITLTVLSVFFLHQKIRLIQFVAIAISYLGVMVISTKGNLLALQFESPLGVGLALLSTLFWAMYWIANTKDQRDPVVALAMNFLCALPCIALYIFFVHGFRQIDPRGLLGAGYVGVFEMGLSFVLWLKAMKLAENTAKLANLIFLSPFLSLIFIRYLVGETILPATYYGLVLIIIGLVLQNKTRVS